MERLHVMQQPASNMSNAFILSIGIHVAILGSALAFAQYTGVQTKWMMPYLNVSLVDAQGRGAVQDMPRAPRAERSVPPPAQAMPAPRDEEQQHVHNLLPAAEAVEDGSALPSSSADVSESSAGHPEGPVLEKHGAGTESGDNQYSSVQWEQLYSALEKVKSYPRFARERGIEGTVLVRLRILPSGDVGAVDIVRSSGSEILDSATVRTMYRAAPLPFVDGWIEVPMSYVLK